MKITMMQRFINLTDNRTSVSQALAMYRYIADCYGRQERFYHSLGHIENMLENQELYFPEASFELKLAIWIHDLYQVSGETRNELTSVVLFDLLQHGFEHGESWKPICSAESLAIVDALVLMTVDHVAHNNNSRVQVWGAMLCDLDLLSLASDLAVYQENTTRIRSEYSCFTDEEWAYGRRRFIRHFLDRPSIFQTGQIYDWFEAKARQNLNDELLLYS